MARAGLLLFVGIGTRRFAGSYADGWFSFESVYWSAGGTDLECLNSALYRPSKHSANWDVYKQV